MYGTQIPLVVETQEGQHYMISNDQMCPESGSVEQFITMNLKNEKKKFGDDKFGFGFQVPRRRRRGTGKKFKSKAH